LEEKNSDSRMNSLTGKPRSAIASLQFAVLLAALALTGCRKEDMSSQPKFYHPYSATAQFADGTTARPIPPGTVARGHLALQTDLFTGMGPDVNGKPYPVSYFPIDITKDDVERGEQKFNIYCAVCHGKLGNGAGMVVTRGMIRPPSLVWVDRPMTAREINVQRAPVGHYFDVITNGYGAMYSYNDKLSVEDRWRVAAYVKALQLSQDGDMQYFVTNLPKPTGAPIPAQTDTTQPYAGKPAPPQEALSSDAPAGGASPGGPNDIRPGKTKPREIRPHAVKPGDVSPAAR
jgi:mono/diheme cytochrome c family protein